MKSLPSQTLIAAIKKHYLEADKYLMQKYVPEFFLDNSFFGDYFNYFIFEPLGQEPPRIYHVFGPYDVITHKAPQQAIIFQDGEVILNIDFTEYVDMRSGVMDAFLLQTLKVTSLDHRPIIMFGSGKIARWSLHYLKKTYPELKTIHFTNQSGHAKPFQEFAQNLAVEAVHVPEPDITQYDILICHTNSNTPVLTQNDIPRLKPGAIITSYRTTSNSGELDTNFFNTKAANIITDWADSLTFAADLKAAQSESLLQPEHTLFLKDLLNDSNLPQKPYTVFRSTGTPMQNLAVLKLLLNQT